MHFKPESHVFLHHTIIMHHIKLLGVIILQNLLLEVNMLQEVWLGVKPETVLRVGEEDAKRLGGAT